MNQHDRLRYIEQVRDVSLFHPSGEPRRELHELNREIERRKQSEDALRQHLQLSEFGREFGLALTKAGTLDEILRRCTELMVQYLDTAFARIWVMQDDGKLLVLRASSGLYTHLDGGHSRVPVGQLKIGFIAASQQPHLTNQVLGDPRVNEQAWTAREGMVAFAGYPLIVDGATIGVMAMFAKRPLPKAAFGTMGSVATQLTIGISRKKTQDSLTQKAAALELANDRKNQFLAMLSHELRNPLAPIRSGLDLLRGERPGNDLIPVMQDNVEYIVRIVDDLLDVSRIMRGWIVRRAGSESG